MQLEEIQTKECRMLPKGRQQVFIVDDDESVCRALKILMFTHGYIVRTFSSAEEFFSAIPNCVTGCLILDIHMPGLRGLEACQQLRNSGSKRPVILITADKSDELKRRLIKAGALGYLTKPVHGPELIGLIDQVYAN